MGTTNILDMNNRIDALEKSFHELKIWATAQPKSVSGNPITLTDGSARNAEGLAVTCEPKQNLHEYDHPWAGGAGKNKLVAPTLDDLKTVNLNGTWNENKYTINGVSFDCLFGEDGRLILVSESGTASASSLFYFKAFTGLNGNYYLSGGVTNDKLVTFKKNGNWSGIESKGTDVSATFETTDSIQPVLSVSSGQSGASVFYPMIRLASESDASFAPYSNECPITGLTECVVEVKDEDETTQHTATITFGQTVYGGSVDFKTGKVTVTYASIANYNGESINEPWLSSIDEYVSGTTPTTGAQVVYPLTTPIELTLTPAELELLKGYNYITTNGTTIALDYLPDSLKADILLTVSQLYGSKISIFDEILAGGDTGQVLTKASDDNYDATWATLPATRTTNKK